MKYELDEIEICEPSGEYKDEYVYDIEMNDDTHTFIANDILVHNSLYLCYNPLLKSIKGYEKMTVEQKRDIIERINTEFMDEHNGKFIDNFYKERFGKSVHKFEMETINRSGCWLEVKKRYAQLLLWKDGRKFDADDMPLKVKGLEMVKASYPSMARTILKDLTRYLLEHIGEPYLIHALNARCGEWFKKWNKADIESICASIGVNNYDKYIIDDSGPALKVAPKCPANVRAAANHNMIMNMHHISGERIYGGKIKVYQYLKNAGKSKKKEDAYEYFAFQSMDYPEWADIYAPISRRAMFQQYVLDPFNRITEPNGMPALNIDGSLEMSLF